MTGSCGVVLSITHSYVKGVGLIDTDGKLEAESTTAVL